MANPPSIVSVSLVQAPYLKYATPRLSGPPAVIDSGLTDSGSSPTWRIRPGNVLVFKTSTNTFVAANDATGDRNAPASVSSTSTGDGTWNNAVVTITLDGGVSFTVTLGAGTATAAAAVTDLNGNARFAASCIADVSATFVRIRTLRAGKQAYISASCGAATFFGSGVTVNGKGTDADYRVLELFADMKDAAGNAQVAIGATLIAGAFVSANLINLTNEAQEVLERKGAIFY